MANSIQFKNSNYLPLMNSNHWVKSEGVYLDSSGNMILPKGASISYEIKDFYMISFAYYKLIVRAFSSGFNRESSVDSNVLMELILSYCSYTGEISDTENSGMNIATVNLVDTGTYEDTKILDTMNKPIYNCVFRVTNLMGEDLVLKSIKLYTSEDFSESQFVDALNKYHAQLKVRKGICGTSSDRSELRYIKVYPSSGNDYIKMKPIYNGNSLLEIILSTGISIKWGYELDEDEVQT